MWSVASCDLDLPSAPLHTVCVCTQHVEHVCTIAFAQMCAETMMAANYLGGDTWHPVWLCARAGSRLCARVHPCSSVSYGGGGVPDLDISSHAVVWCRGSVESEGGGGKKLAFHWGEHLGFSKCPFRKSGNTMWSSDEARRINKRIRKQGKRRWKAAAGLCVVTGYRLSHGSERSLAAVPLAELTQLWMSCHRPALAHIGESAENSWLTSPRFFKKKYINAARRQNLWKMTDANNGAIKVIY